MAEPTKDENSALLYRFLYLGDESKTFPASVSYPFKLEKYQTIFDSSGSEKDIASEISRIFRDGHFLTLEPMIYTLAALAHSKDAVTKSSALKVASEVCVTAKAMLLFCYFCSELSKPMKGYGRSLRTFLSKWYNNKDAKDLAVEVTKTKSCNKWTHKDVLCMSHIKPANSGIAAILKYAVKGYEATEKEFSSDADTEPILKYLKAVCDVGRAEDPETAARLIEIHDLCLEQIPSKLLKTKEVSLCLISRVPIKILLTLLPQFCKSGLLKLNSPHYKTLLERLASEEVLNDSRLDPLESFVGIRKWQLANRLFPGKTLVRQNTPAIDDALQNLHLMSFKSVVPSNKRYLIAVDIRPYMSQSACGGCRCVSPSNVCEIVLLALVKAELNNVTVLVFSTEELIQVDINNKMTISDVNEHLNKNPPGTVKLFSLPQWALVKKKPFDLFLVLTDSFSGTYNEGWIDAFNEYKETLHLPNSRYIVASLSDQTIANLVEEPSILQVAGFNVRLLKIIQDFACGVF